MHWIRSNCRFGAWAALFALAIQLVLSFGHIHAEDFRGSSAAAAQSLTQPDTRGDGDGAVRHDICAICASLNLTSSSLVPAVELPAAPVAHPYRWDAALRPVRISSNLHFLFQARAPPSV